MLETPDWDIDWKPEDSFFDMRRRDPRWQIVDKKWSGGSSPILLVRSKRMEVDPIIPRATVDKSWDFDSHLFIRVPGHSRLMQVWSRPSREWDDTRDWVLTEDTPGKENPPKTGYRYYTSTESFKKSYPYFER